MVHPLRSSDGTGLQERSGGYNTVRVHPLVTMTTHNKLYKNTAFSLKKGNKDSDVVCKHDDPLGTMNGDTHHTRY